MGILVKTHALSVLIFIAILSSGVANAKPKYGPAESPAATPLFVASEYFRRAEAEDFWRLIGYYVPQFSGSACSVASVSMVINAALSRRERTSDDKVVSQAELLDRVRVEGWKSRIVGIGIRGTTLEQLGRIVEAVFKEYKFEGAKVRVVHVAGATTDVLEGLRKDLRENERSGRNFIIANFDQKMFTDDASAGHIAPIGAYDEKLRRVLILDPDREYYEPYWVSDENFLRGMATKDVMAKVNRGYVFVSF